VHPDDRLLDDHDGGSALTMRIERLTDGNEAAYDRFLRESPDSLFFASNQYRKFLRNLLEIEDRYLLAMEDDGSVRAALPLFAIRGAYGTVLNSLPYYGSSGGIIRRGQDEVASAALMEAFNELSRSLDCVASTVVSSPLDDDQDFYRRFVRPDYVDRRIGQLTRLVPNPAGIGEEELMVSFHHKTRNMIRKARKLGVEVREEMGKEALSFLSETHMENMREIGGQSKSIRFFELLETQLKFGTDYRIYTAWQGRARIAALLVLYFNRVVEYGTPVIKKEFRDSQGLSLAIVTAMRNAVREGYIWWNWGGTWVSQDGVYRFKKRWGTMDKDYHYYTRVFDRSLLSRTPGELVSAYPNFYVLPFSALQQEQTA
jgi:hypothetical protein